MTNLTRADLAVLDTQDPLASRRALFEIPEGVIYLDGNSLGVLPKAARQRVAQVVEQEWGVDLIRSWGKAGWMDLATKVGGKIAALVGAKPNEVIAADTTSLNLFKLASAALKLRPGRRKIVSEAGNFPTDLYILQGVVAQVGQGVELVVAERGRVLDAVDEDTALVVLTHVHYKSAEIFDMAGVTAAVQAKGALMLWDLSHSTGAVDIDLNAAKADLAIGCGYKYLNGGPGAPAFLFVAEQHLPGLEQPLSGWMGHARPFDFVDQYEPVGDIRRALCGTPPVLALSALDSALDAFDGVSMQEVRAKSMLQRRTLLDLIKQRCAAFDFGFEPDGDARTRGSHVSIHHPEAYAICQALIARGVIGDFRAPDALRLGLTPLYLGYADLWDAVEHLVQVMEGKAWDSPQFQARAAVT
jgi:kynureninase